jgi:hypothetical protein
MNTLTKRKTKQIATVLSIMMVGGLVSGCSFLKKEQVQDKEVLLLRAGFTQKFSTGPENLAYLKTFKQEELIKLADTSDTIAHLNILTESDKLKSGNYYLFVDIEDCDCFYWGSEDTYNKYQDVLKQQKIADFGSPGN